MEVSTATSGTGMSTSEGSDLGGEVRKEASELGRQDPRAMARQFWPSGLRKPKLTVISV